MNRSPKISVVMAIYNGEKYLREALGTVVSQTLKEIEIICINDGSTDATLQILQEYQNQDPRIQVFTQKNQGPGVARNNGISRAAGKYVFFLDGDDLLVRDALEKVYQLAEKNEAELVVYGLDTFSPGQTGFTSGTYPLIKNLPDHEVFSGEEIVRDRLRTLGGHACNKLILREFLLHHHLVFLDQYSFEDAYFSATAVASAQRICVLDEPLLHYRRFSEGMSVDFIKATTDTPRCMHHLKRWLHDHEKWDEFRIDFVNFAAEYLLKNLYYISESIQKAYYNKLRDNTFPCLELSSQPISAFYKAVHYFEIQRIVSLNYEQFCEVISPGCSREAHTPRLIVSLTSYPMRIGTAHKAIYQLLAQSEKADQVILWLTEEDFPGREQDLPQKLLELKHYGLEIEWCSSLGAYQKLIFAIRKYPDAVVVTADDDVVYNTDWLRILWDSYQKQPECIHCHRPAMLEIQDSVFYWTATGKRFYSQAAFLHKPISHAGILYPPHCLHPDVFRKDLFLEMAPTNAELWFWIMAIRNGTKIAVAEHNIPTPKYIEGTQAETLSQVNDTGRLEKDLRRLISVFPDILQPLNNETICEIESIRS